MGLRLHTQTMHSGLTGSLDSIVPNSLQSLGHMGKGHGLVGKSVGNAGSGLGLTGLCVTIPGFIVISVCSH